jgi:hypothetical protein
MSTSRGWSIARWLLLAIACALVFAVPSAALIDRGSPRWLAAIAGALAFPLAPVAWHVLAERARLRRVAAMKASPKASLTAGDRFVLRLVAVALVACAPWWLLARERTWHALRHHGGWLVTWVVPSGGGAPLAGKQMLALVPGDAEAVIWVRGGGKLDQVATNVGARRNADDGGDDLQEGVLAFKKGEMFGVVRASKIDLSELDKIDQDQAKKWLGHELHLVSHRIADDTVVVASDGWDAAYVARAMGRRPGPAALLALLDRAPADAPLLAAAMPRTPRAGLPVHDATAWLRPDGEQLVAHAIVHAADAAGAAKVATSATSQLAHARQLLPGSCTSSVGEILDAVHVSTAGDAITVDVKIPGEQLAAAMLCALPLR